MLRRLGFSKKKGRILMSIADSETSFDRRFIPSPDEFVPRCVIRYMSALYGRVPYVFRDEPEASCTIFVDMERPTGPLDASMRQKFIDATLQTVCRSGFRMCVVFGPEDAVFCERDGTTVASNEPPSGGVRMKDLMPRG